jgi:hypothetical protein
MLHCSDFMDPRPGEWSGAIEFGREADDSDMAAAAAYRVGNSAGEVVEGLLEEANWFRYLDWVKDPRTNEWSPTRDPAKLRPTQMDLDTTLGARYGAGPVDAEQASTSLGDERIVEHKTDIGGLPDRGVEMQAQAYSSSIDWSGHTPDALHLHSDDC